jgi:diguanylate cyclase (GGDEF)-like protein
MIRGHSGRNRVTTSSEIKLELYPELDPGEAERRKKTTAYRVNAVQVPAIRIVGFAGLSAVLWLHNRFLLPVFDPAAVARFAAATLLYSLVSWAVLIRAYRSGPKPAVSLAFFVADLVPVAMALALSGGESSLLFFVLMMRAADQVSRGTRRALLFAHLATVTWAAVIAWRAFGGAPVSWPLAATKGVFIWGAGVYLALSAHPADLLRRKKAAAMRVARELILQLGERTRELEESREALQEKATHDALTGLWNRSSILQVVERGVARARHEGDFFAVVLADLDYFKDINDAYGHRTGDEALLLAARRLQASLRPLDAIGRYGGEEFLIALPSCGREEAIVLADRLRVSLAEEEILPRGATGISLTCSFGVAACEPGEDIGLDSLIRTADAALYLAKKRGRNRVEAAAGLTAAAGGK